MTTLLSDGNLATFLFASVFLGGGAAWLTGRALALTWRPVVLMGVYALLLGAVVRFIHYAVFRGAFLSLHYYAVDALVCLFAGLMAFRLYRMRQMRAQYGWMQAPTSPPG